MTESFPNIIYIMGTGRSGTTILDVLLSNSPGVVGCGELNHIFREGFTYNNTCSCGKKCKACSFWSEVQLAGNFKTQDCLNIFDFLNKIEWHWRFLLHFFNLIDKRSINKYKDINRRLFSSIQKVSKCHSIVDSSKFPGRGLALFKNFGSKVKVICITRSPQGIFQSFQKKNIEQINKSPFSVLLYYAVVMFYCRLTSIYPKLNMLHIRYEDIISDPIKTIGSIEKWLEQDLSETKRKVQNNEFLDVKHVLRGNRLRKKGRIKFDPKNKVPPLQKASHKCFVFLMNIVKILLNF